MELSTLTVDGQQISGFDPTVKEYTYTVERGDMTVPTVAATASDTANTVEVVPAEKMPGDTKVIVRTSQGISETYTVHFNKTGTPGVVSNIYAGGQATTAVTAVPSLGAEMIDMYNVYETDAERIAAVKSPNNPYASYDYAQYTDRLSGEAWENKSGPDAIPANTYGAANEFTYLNHPDSILISPDVTRLYKSTTDPCGDEETAKRAYELISARTRRSISQRRRRAASFSRRGGNLKTMQNTDCIIRGVGTTISFRTRPTRNIII